MIKPAIDAIAGNGWSGKTSNALSPPAARSEADEPELGSGAPKLKCSWSDIQGAFVEMKLIHVVGRALAKHSDLGALLIVCLLLQNIVV